jgi:hypothetical protein
MDAGAGKWLAPCGLRLVVQTSPKDLNLDNPEQAEGAARGYPNLTPVGVRGKRHLSFFSTCKRYRNYLFRIS